MSQPEERNEDLLQSALSSAFTPISITPTASISQAEAASTSSPQASLTVVQPSAPLVSQEERQKWEEENAAIERSWKEQSAIDRKEAEERRARIAVERAASGETWEKLDQEKPPRGPPNLLPAQPGYPGSPSPVDVRDRVSGEPSGSRTHALEASQASSHTFSHSTTPEQSQPWEEIDNVPSMESSYPSLSFPEQSDSTSPELPASYDAKSRAQRGGKQGSTAEKSSAAAGVVAPPSATFSVFDSRLSTRSRAIALISSLSINFLLPFVNGVMLGFGEIFAKSLAARLGWKIPGGAATAVGIGASKPSKRR
ncbi:hypothetical protein EW145_g3640 [Phellinidium pouzarii]|uniref:Uncharacterized protein n=1 Tax=Phellinidium pouzarii TaxID=167371 RepID=A0A4S4LBN4_9AGAM|nr:hypothetical protein EW145_g3640 [Phellinidium pouzarii]